MNSAIIVAAGSGSRFGSETPKQFVEVCGKPLLLHTIERFVECVVIDEIIVVLSKDGIRAFENSNLKSEITKAVKIVEGGGTRAESVRNGLAAISVDAKIAAVHDGARPLVEPGDIAATVRKAIQTGAACLVASVTDTIKTVSGDAIAGTLDREGLRQALTPQAFRVEVLKRAFEICDDLSFATDECCLVEKLGYPIAFVEGSSTNIKVTRPEDLLFVQIMLSRKSASLLEKCV